MRLDSFAVRRWLLAVPFAAVTGSLPAQIYGRWLYSYDHPQTAPLTSPGVLATWPATFEAINMAVIPVSNNVIVWDSTGVNLSLATAWPQRFAVGDPESMTFTNYIVSIPAGYGDLFCSGHCWLPDGRLFVAGGNTLYLDGSPTQHFEGSRFVGFWDPTQMNNGFLGWNFSLLTGPNPKPMNKRRWYPTVTLISDRLVMVSGGSEDTSIDNCGPGGVLDPAINTYEVFDLSVNDWERDSATNLPRLYNGPPPASCSVMLGGYPRLHLVSTNHIFLSGGWRNSSSRVDHDSNNPLQTWMGFVPSGVFRSEGASVLVPNVGNTLQGRDQVMIIGGGVCGSVSHNTSLMIDAGAVNPTWGNQQTMHFGRMTANAVLTPNGDVVAIGGCADFYFTSPSCPNPIYTPVLKSEVWDKISGWVSDDAQVSPRMYHSTAALLPSGRIVSAGSDIRTTDWEIYEPRYLANGQTIPTFIGDWALSGSMDVSWGAQYEIGHAPLPVGVAISRVVLMRPCSTTHHSDMDQRYVELQTIYPDDATGPPPANIIKVQMPPSPIWTGVGSTNRGAVTTPPGFYMAFLVTSQGTPSQAKWVRLQ